MANIHIKEPNLIKVLVKIKPVVQNWWKRTENELMDEVV
jgi:hypothetical protein